jgi:hypothetical protein
MRIIIIILAIYGLAFAIRETSGPWDIISRARNWMMRLPIIGVPFYQLLQCYYCLGCWCGIIVYLLITYTFHWNWMICYGLAGGTICLLIDAILMRLHRE